MIRGMDLRKGDALRYDGLFGCIANPELWI
jgi:hypothetical protein